jgi:hypothetical protein
MVVGDEALLLSTASDRPACLPDGEILARCGNPPTVKGRLGPAANKRSMAKASSATFGSSYRRLTTSALSRMPGDEQLLLPDPYSLACWRPYLAYTHGLGRATHAVVR